MTGVLRDTIAAAGVPADRIEVVPNGIDPAKFVALPAREASDGPVVLGFVGFVRDWHGLDAVIDAMAADRDGPKVRLVVVGGRSGARRRWSGRRRRWGWRSG